MKWYKRPVPIVFSMILMALLILAAFLFLIRGAAPTPDPLPQGSSSGSGIPASMDDYWNGRAEWSFFRKDTNASTGVRGYYAGASVRVMKDGTWYLFNRKAVKDPSIQCGTGDVLETQVRKSTDKGVTWSDPVVIVPHKLGTAYSCAATDGGVWYNEKENKWVYLFQCLDNSSSSTWNGCVLSREGDDPMGPFTIEPPGGNPVIVSGQLWNAICDDFDDDCSSLSFGPRQVYDEGTFDIFKYDGTYYWVGFHGFDRAHGFRGIAKTADFQTWIAGDPSQGVPSDAIQDLQDSATWREQWDQFGSIGVGAGSMIEEGDYYYNLVEASDINLSCLYNQNWDIGLFRSKSLTNTAWEQYPGGNPIIYSSKAKEEERGSPPCNVQYARLFQDPTNGFTYMAYGRNSNDPEYDGFYWYRLEKSYNLLTNGNLWRADTEGWKTDGEGVKIEALRLPNNSPDGTPYMAISCKEGCGKSSAVYQEIEIPTNAEGIVRFGGKFLSEEKDGALDILVRQMNADHKMLRTDKYSIAASTSWASFDQSIALKSKTVLLRYEIIPRNGGLTYRADDLYVETSTSDNRRQVSP
ncbi:hypothetical protein [Cohnella nanjingensis]|uniref:Exo-alpha-sialidase n=1 Tax=Cohnella nanjingensis TaxID=1387779 RepID=A0A7X0VII0_9BACL|nr:hypothetical protein [Cohnella nanjingensis]MBB6674573.1 hypothetical protein [Cohnella nanjingensis]